MIKKGDFMNEVIQQLFERKSVRVFEEKEIEEEIVREILLSSSLAPTAGNQQLYTILRITDKDLLHQLSESCDHQPFIEQGKLVLIFCADCKKWYDAFQYSDCKPRKPGTGDLMLAVNDACIAAQNAVVAAHSYGIGSCYIGDIMENIETQRELLHLPEYVFPACMLVFGYPVLSQINRKKPERVDLKYLVHENTYPEWNENNLFEMFKKNCRSGDYNAWMQAFCKRKYNSDFSKEMTRSINEYLKQYK